MSAGSTVNGEHVSATMAIATVVHTRFCRSCTFKLFSKVANTSCGPIALAMYPNVFTVARRIDFLCACKKRPKLSGCYIALFRACAASEVKGHITTELKITFILRSFFPDSRKLNLLVRVQCVSAIKNFLSILIEATRHYTFRLPMIANTNSVLIVLNHCLSLRGQEQSPLYNGGCTKEKVK